MQVGGVEGSRGQSTEQIVIRRQKIWCNLPPSLLRIVYIKHQKNSFCMIQRKLFFALQAVPPVVRIQFCHRSTKTIIQCVCE